MTIVETVKEKQKHCNFCNDAGMCMFNAFGASPCVGSDCILRKIYTILDDRNQHDGYILRNGENK